MKKHRCRKEDIDWDGNISDRFITEDGLGWFGKCRQCGRKVYEIYAQLSCLHDANTHEDLAENCEEK
ncbi:MAG: hypothetical protein ACE5JI_21315 [Acidobacteriota bacterium]